MSNKRILLGIGDLVWDAVERQTDRYGTVRLTNQEVKNGPEHDILIDRKHDEHQGKKGKLIAKVIWPVKSPHMGDLHRGLRPQTPKLFEEVLFGEGFLFIEHRGQDGPHEQGFHEKAAQEMWEAVEKDAKAQGMRVTKDPQAVPRPDEAVYDLIGLSPEDNRKKDWLDPKAFYKTHLSKVELYFEPSEE